MLRQIELNHQIKNKIEETIIEFNAVPKLKSIRGLLNTESQHEVAEFLLTTPGISKEKVGVFLGHPDQKDNGVLLAFAQTIDFSGLDMVSAMRLFLSLFRLPGESQQIERIMDAFSRVYYHDNPDDFKDHEEVYVLAFSFIFLNTLTFNKNVAESRKMKREDFVRINSQAL